MDTLQYVSIDDIPETMSEDDYAEYLARQKRKSYSNHASENADGEPVDVDDYINEGIAMLLSYRAGE